MSDEDILSLSLEHNFWTWSAQNHVSPIPVNKAEGVYFWDINHKRYLDFNSMVMCVNIGHGNSYVVDSMCKQLRDLPFAGPGMATRPRAILGEKLCEILPQGLNKYLYTLGGADANENAIKLARGYTGKHKILARYRSYHGATAGAMAATGDPRRTAWEPLTMPGVIHFLDPYRYRSTFHRTNPEISDADFSIDYLNHLEEIIIYERPETIAAVLIESITGTNGIIIPPNGYMQGVREICDRYGIVLICDEVMSGFGRTGKWFAVDHWSVIPDIMSMAKGLTSGYAPLGAVAMKPEIAAAFNDRVFEGGLTFNGHPVCMAAAIATIEFMQNENIVKKAAETGKIMKSLLEDLEERHPSIGDIRSIGLFGVIELVKNRKSKEPISSYNQTSKEMTTLKNYLFDHGLFIYTHWHTILLVPPLIISAEQLKEGFEIIDQGLQLIDKAIGYD